MLNCFLPPMFNPLATNINRSSGQDNRREGYGLRGHGRFYGGGSSQVHNRLCTHSDKTNHTIETCYLLHGFPPYCQLITFLMVRSMPIQLILLSITVAVTREAEHTSENMNNNVSVTQELVQWNFTCWLPKGKLCKC
jgi:hypothetical protein